MNESHSTLAELVTGNAAAARVLHRHRLDFCCGGGRSLAEACGARGLSPQAVLAEIAAEAGVASADGEGEELAPAEMTAFIVRRYHEPLREELPRLIALAGKVERVHAEKPECPRGLADHLAAMERAIEEHLAKEEQILFPMIAAGRGHLAGMPVKVMMQEHLDHAAGLERMRRLAHDLVVPECACASWRALYDGLDELELELNRHIHLENNVLFPRALAR